MVDEVFTHLEDVYNKNYFENSHDTTEVGYKNYTSNPAAEVIGKYAFARLFQQDVSSHLDLGSADGSLLEMFSSSGFDSMGLEVSSDAVEIANSKGLNAVTSDLNPFPSKAKNKAVVTAFDVLEHVAYPGRVLESSYKALDENGYFVFSTVSVKSTRPTEYWFNHSLEHFVYYNRANLSRQLSDVFGKKNFLLQEITTNGVSQFWGVAKKGSLTKKDARIFEALTDTAITVSSDEAYWLSLFYDQTAQFNNSEKCIEKHSISWLPGRMAKARFFLYYFQGKFEQALHEVTTNGKFIEADTVFWQAAFRAKEQLTELEKQTLKDESSDEIIALRGQLFKAKDEINSLRNSRVLGRIIKTRDFLTGTLFPGVYHFPMRAIRGVKIRVARHLPDWFRKPFMKVIRFRPRHMLKKVRVVTNKPWTPKTPLVSVVIPYYNRADTIDDTLYSLKRQTFLNFEVIIVDDGSPEEVSQRKLKAIEKEGYRATFIYQQNQGVAKARNNGIAAAKGKYIVCLDSDDMIESTYIEKMVTVLETNPDISIATSYMSVFGVTAEDFQHVEFDPLLLYRNNSVITAAMFRKEAWKATTGYKTGIGYEDWEFWISLAEKGFWGKLVPEPLFRYRTSMQSRYVEDKEIHWNNLRTIRSLHPNYKKKIKTLLKKRELIKHEVSVSSSMINLQDPVVTRKSKSNILITIPWMTFGGAETLIYNFCREIKDDYAITFVTGLPSKHEWQYKFEEISNDIFHLANLFTQEDLYVEYVSRLITVRSIDTLHIIHNGFTFEMLETLKQRHPNLRVIVTLFNDRTAYFEQSIQTVQYIDTFTSDNQSVVDRFNREAKLNSGDVRCIPNGINCINEFNPELFNREAIRSELGIPKNDIAVFFVGRLSEEKNPDVFVETGARVIGSKDSQNVHFFVIGDGGMRKKIKDRIDDIGNSKLTYLGYQSEVARYLAAADVFVLPSSIEGFPLSILEAMAMKVVTIASDVGAVSQVLENGVDGYVVSPGSVDEIVKAITVLNKDRKKLDIMKQLSRDKIEKLYSNPVLGRNYRKLYGESK